MLGGELPPAGDTQRAAVCPRSLHLIPRETPKTHSKVPVVWTKTQYVSANAQDEEDMAYMQADTPPPSPDLFQ